MVSPPVQGGILILDRATVDKAVDVPVSMHLKFQQSFEFLNVPLTQFIVRVLVIPVMPQRHWLGMAHAVF